MLVFFSILFGLVIGSFLNVVIYRLPRNQSIVLPRSSCINCRNKLGFFDLIPFFSWIILKGRCRFCKEKISIRYPFIELLSSFLFVLCLFSSPSSIDIDNDFFILITGWVLVCYLIPLAYIDIDFLWLPSSLNTLGILSGIVLTSISFLISNQVSEDLFIIDNLFATIVGFSSFRIFSLFIKKLIKRPGLGHGDAKLAAMAGSYLGLTGLEITIVLSVLTAGIASIFFLLNGIIKRGEYIPFGPFIALSIFLVWFCGNEFWLIKLGNIFWWRYL